MRVLSIIDANNLKFSQLVIGCSGFDATLLVELTHFSGYNLKINPAFRIIKRGERSSIDLNITILKFPAQGTCLNVKKNRVNKKSKILLQWYRYTLVQSTFGKLLYSSVVHLKITFVDFVS